MDKLFDINAYPAKKTLKILLKDTILANAATRRDTNTPSA